MITDFFVQATPRLRQSDKPCKLFVLKCLKRLEVCPVCHSFLDIAKISPLLQNRPNESSELSYSACCGSQWFETFEDEPTEGPRNWNQSVLLLSVHTI